MRRLTLLTMAALLAGLVMACSDGDYKDPPTGVDAGLDSDGDVQQDAIAIVDVADMPDRAINPEGPDITIIEPQPAEVLEGRQTEVVATVTDDDGVDVSSVRAVIPGGATFPLSRSGTVDNQYIGNIDLSEIPTTNNMTIFVEAADILENWNSAEVELVRDLGPTVNFILPVQDDRYKGSVNLRFQVNDINGVLESSVTARIGSVDLTIVKLFEDTVHGATPQWILFGGEIDFDDSMFEPPLQSTQQVTVTAQNIGNSVSSISSMTFVVDEEGPEITMVSPLPGEIVGGIITIEATINDDAGVSTSSVMAVINGGVDNEHLVPLLPMGSTFSGSFDTNQLYDANNPVNVVFPTLSVRAADTLNNKSEVGFVLALDNTSPKVSLDPPDNMRIWDEIVGTIMCTRAFDPVGADNPSDGSTVPQVHFMRVRIEDQGNQAAGLLQVPLSLVNYATPRVYWLANTTQALVVDTDGDGYCDEINPELIPSTNPQGGSEILALYLEPIPPISFHDGNPDLYMEPDYPLSLWMDQGETCQSATGIVLPTGDLCGPVRDFMTVALHYTPDNTEPAIWSLPPISSADPLFCTGHQFDNFASNIPEGWVCAAARAVDNAGNIGISKPIRICVDYDYDYENDPPHPCGDIANAPSCTGTIDPQTQTVNPNVPCSFRNSQTFDDYELRENL